MNTLKKNNSGFTLLEIIIVVIIVGVLASLALPRLFRNVEFSRSTEAMAAIGAIRSSMERCLIKNGTNNYAGTCATLAATPTKTTLDLPDPVNNSGSHFSYAINNPSTGGYTIVATRNTLQGSNGGDTISVQVTIGTPGTIAVTGVGAYADL